MTRAKDAPELPADLASLLDDANLPKRADYYKPPRVDLLTAQDMALKATQRLLQSAVRRLLASEGERDAARAAAGLFERAAAGAVAMEDALRRCVGVLELAKGWLMPVEAAKEVVEALVVAKGVLEGKGDG